MIPKSKQQREREARRDDHPSTGAVRWSGDEDEVASGVPADEQVRVYKGAPFAPAGAVDKVAGQAFVKPPPEPPFKLTGKQYRELTERSRPRIAFPKDEPCPITRGEVYPVTTQLSFVVTGISETKTEWELHYELLDERPHNLGKLTGYASSQKASIATRKPREDQPLGGPQFRAETEPGALEDSEREEIVGESRADRLKRLKAHRVLLREQHRRMEQEGVQADVRWGIRLAITSLTQRIDNEQRRLEEEGKAAA